LTFNQVLVDAEERQLFQTGFRSMFALVAAAVERRLSRVS